MENKHLYKQALSLYEELKQLSKNQSSSKAVMICRQLHLIEQQLDQPITEKTVKQFLGTSQ